MSSSLIYGSISVCKVHLLQFISAELRWNTPALLNSTLSTAEVLLPQTDRATRYVRQNVNCRNKLYSMSATNRNNRVRGLQLTDL